MNLDELIADFRSDWVASEEVRDKANEEYRFITIPGAHWEGWLEDAYENRAKMEMNHISEYCRRTFSQWTTNRQTVNYSAADSATSAEDADLLTGIFRRDYERRGGQASIDTAVWESFTCGVGAVILNTEYEDEYDDESDHQNIIISEQPNAYSTVIFDCGARRADKADAKRCVVRTPYQRKVFEEMWPNKNATSLVVSDRAVLNSHGASSDIIFVGTRYEVDVHRTTVHTFTNPQKADVYKVNEEELDATREELEMLGYKLVRSRKVKRRAVYKTVFSGADVLEPRRKIVGEYIPVIPFFGFRGYVDGIEYYHGLARERMDVQRVLNMSFSLAAESAAHSFDSKPIFDPEQMVNPTVRNQWAENWHQKPYVLAGSLRDAQGNITVSGPVGMLPGTQLSGSVNALIQMSKESLQAGTGGAPQDIADPNASGKAINALISRIDQNTEMVHDNTRKSITHLGVVYESMAREIYGGARNANREIRVVNDRGEASDEVLSKAGFKDGLTVVNDLSRGKFEVVSGFSPDYKNEDEETFEALKDITTVFLPEDPLRAVLGRSMFLLKSGAGLNDLKEYVSREMMVAGYLKPTSDEDKAYVQQTQQAQQNAASQPDPNAVLMEEAAAELETKAQLNQAKTADAAASAVKKSVEAEQLKLENAELKIKLEQMLGSAPQEPTYANG